MAMSMDDWQDEEPQDDDMNSSAERRVIRSLTMVQPRVGEPVEDAPADEPETAAVDEAKPQWYVVHCYSGYENKVKKNLEHRIESMGMASRINRSHRADRRTGRAARRSAARR